MDKPRREDYKYIEQYVLALEEYINQKDNWHEPEELFYKGKQLTENGIYTNPFYKYVISYDINNVDKEFNTYELFEFVDYLVNKLKKDYENKQNETIKNLLGRG